MSHPSPLSLATPSLLPAETAFSWISRYHALSGNRVPAQTSLALFGAVRRGYHHDFPTHLDQLSARLNFVLGAAEDWALERTLLPYYLRLRAPHEVSGALELMTTGSSGMLKFRLGILTSRFRAHHPLKACPQCMVEQREQYGVAYWVLEHQYPGIWVCLKHRVALQQCKLKAGINRFGFVLPREAELFDVGPGVPSASLVQLAAIVSAYAKLPVDRHLATDTLARTYLSALGDIGIGAMETRYAPKRLSQQFLEALEPLKVIPELQGLPATNAEAFNQLDRWLLRPRGGTHPLRHLSIVFWLFPSWQEFWDRYEEIEATPPQQRSELTPRAASDNPRKISLLRDLRAGCSLTRAAKINRVSIKTAQCWAASAGISPDRRPKTLKEQALQQLVAALQAGADKQKAARSASVSIETVTHILRTEPGLSSRWKEARWTAAQTAARSAYTSAARSQPDICVKELRAAVPSAYAWLYRNDQAWLASINSKIRNAHAAMPRPQRLDWEQRDRDMHIHILHALATAPPATGATKLQYLFRSIPALRAKRRSMQRLPRTKALLDELAKTGPQ